MVVSPAAGGFEAEVCMDMVPNPQNSRWLSEVTVGPKWSLDGSAPIGQRPVSNSPGGYLNRVEAGNCKMISEPLSTLGSSIPFNARHLMIVGNWGPNGPRGPTEFYMWSNDPCPSLELIPRMSSDDLKTCFFRTSYDLGYQW